MLAPSHATYLISVIFITGTSTFTVCASAITVFVMHRKAHGTQRAPKALAVLLPRALNNAAKHVEHAHAILLHQGEYKEQECLARKATGRVRFT